MACSCKSSNNVTTVKQVVKKTKVRSSKSSENKPTRTVSRKISYRRPI